MGGAAHRVEARSYGEWGGGVGTNRGKGSIKRYIIIAITLHYILRYRLMLYLCGLSLPIVIAFDSYRFSHMGAAISADSYRSRNIRTGL